MLKLHIIPHLSNNAGVVHYFSLRKLYNDEVALVRLRGLERYHLQQLSSDQQQNFFQEFDKFWEQIIRGRDWQESFWRNGISSKMQEWEDSIGYLALSLFTLSVNSFNIEELVVLPGSIEEAEIWRSWAIEHGLVVVSYGFGGFQRIKQEINNCLRSVRLFVLCILKKLRASKFLPIIRSNAILAVTMFYCKSIRAEKYEDLFFGNLAEEIAHFDRDILYVGDALDKITYRDSMRMGKAGYPVSIYSFLSWRDIIAVWLIVFKRVSRVKDAAFLEVNFSAVFLWYARRARYDFNLTAEVFYRAIKYACHRYKFAKMLYAYEGNVYERAAVQAFREETHASIDAYSRAVLYPLNLKLYASPSESELAPEPDRYLACSEYACNTLRQLRRVKTVMITTCSLRPIFKLKDIKKSNGENILVVLDGVWSVTIMLDWLYQNADVFKGRPIIIRPHPNVGWDGLIRQCPNYQAGLFSISQQPLKDDFENAFCVLYRQSSVGIQALRCGIPSIHLKVDQPLCGDPLFGADFGRLVVRNVSELSKALSMVFALRKEILSANNSASDFATKYFSPLNPELFKIFAEINS
ncbi:MAG: hypothetical protein QMD94_03725 [Candidatus Omnitrophota bacterium]|nr:hypothetical protein [Candidatus Omnitrophota bacterium]